MNKLKVSSLKEGASLTLLIFIAIVSIVEVVGPFITSIQSSILSFLGSGVGSAAAGITVTAGKIIDTLTKQSITETALLGIGIIFILPAILSTIVFCIFCAIVAISPRGKYTVYDIAIAFGVLILESLPFTSGFTGWAGFAYYLKWRETLDSYIKK